MARSLLTRRCQNERKAISSVKLWNSVVRLPMV
jgi:hypothetical protein